jgi:hypothetical protein
MTFTFSKYRQFEIHELQFVNLWSVFGFIELSRQRRKSYIALNPQKPAAWS